MSILKKTMLMILDECLKAEKEDYFTIFSEDYKRGRIEMCEDLMTAVKENL